MTDNAKLLNVNEAAAQLGISVSTLNKLRLTGGGPDFIKMGWRVQYDPRDLQAYIDARRRSSTSQADATPAGR